MTRRSSGLRSTAEPNDRCPASMGHRTGWSWPWGGPPEYRLPPPAGLNLIEGSQGCQSPGPRPTGRNGRAAFPARAPKPRPPRVADPSYDHPALASTQPVKWACRLDVKPGLTFERLFASVGSMAVRHSHDTDNAVEAPDLKLADVVDTIKRYCSQEDPSDSGAALGDRLIELRHAIDVMEVRFSETAAAFAGTDQYDRDGSASPIDWIRHRCRMSGHAAADRVRVGKQLRRLAESAEAVSAGQIGFAHLSLLASTARALTTSPTALEPFDEAALLTAARDSSVGRFRHVS